LFKASSPPPDFFNVPLPLIVSPPLTFSPMA
jgi:hypothetical protein